MAHPLTLPAQRLHDDAEAGLRGLIEAVRGDPHEVCRLCHRDRDLHYQLCSKDFFPFIVLAGISLALFHRFEQVVVRHPPGYTGLVAVDRLSPELFALLGAMWP